MLMAITIPVNMLDRVGYMADAAVAGCGLLAGFAAANWWNPLGWGAAIFVTGGLYYEVAKNPPSYADGSQVVEAPPSKGDLTPEKPKITTKSSVTTSVVTNPQPPKPPKGLRKGDLKKLAEKYIQRILKLDAHKIKQEYLAKGASISRYDLAMDAATKIIDIIDKAGRIIAKTHYRGK